MVVGAETSLPRAPHPCRRRRPHPYDTSPCTPTHRGDPVVTYCPDLTNGCPHAAAADTHKCCRRRRDGWSLPLPRLVPSPMLGLVVLLPLLLLTAAADAKRDDLIVNTEKGRVRGIRYYLPSLGKAVDAYLGIPFAKPPIGHLRFRHPQPIEPWDLIYNATKLPNSCYQNPDTAFGPTFHGSNMWNSPTRVSEDCLYLNVWVPKTHPRIRKSAVLVWIFGGGFYSGTTTLNLYDGKILAAENNLIVVSIGYRVGALGFLSLGHPSTPGNAGLFDQLMGLDWVQNNIRYFGGDPNNVTIFGESAGSVSVSLHLLSPLSRSKFQRAIIQSGVAQMPWATHDMKEARRRAVELAVVILACPQTDDMEVLAECLRSISPQTLVDNQWVSRGIIQFPFLPVIDGAFLVETPLMSLKRRSFKRCPLLMGSNLNEASFFLIYELPQFLTLNSTTMTRQQFLESINELFFHYPQYPQTINSIGLDAIAFQYSNWLDPEDKLANIRMLDGAVGDCHFTCHVNHFGHRYATAGENVYMYYFTERYKSNPWPEWMGVLHGDEILFTMGEVLKSGGNFTNDEKELSRKMMKYWTNFAKSGDPNRSPGEPSLDEWPLHTPQGKEYLELNSKHLRLPPAERERSVGRGPRAKECAFWVEYLPHLIATTDVNECCSDPCLNGATCIDGQNRYSCQCAPGFEGTHCEDDVPECDSNPCQHGATCNDFTNYFTCTCPPGYVGFTCAIAIHPQPNDRVAPSLNCSALVSKGTSMVLPHTASVLLLTSLAVLLFASQS